MSNLFFGLNIGRSGLVSNQAALDITGHNLANVQTEGYSRQRAALVQSIPVQVADHTFGSGVSLDGVERLQLGWLERQVNRVQVRNGYDAMLSRGISELQTLLGEPAADGIGTAMSSFWNSWEALSVRPTDSGLRAQVIEQAQHLATVYNQKIEGFQAAEARFDEQLTDLIASVNETAAELADINGAIAKAEAAGRSANDLRDQRDQLVSQVARQLGVEVETDGSYLNLRLPGGGPYLVNRIHSFEITHGVNELGHATDFRVGNGPAPISGGEAEALLKLRDDLSAGLRADLNRLMGTVADRVNELHTAGYDRDGEPGRNLFVWSGAGSRVDFAGSANLVEVAADPALEVGTHRLQVTAVDPALTPNGRGTLSAGSVSLSASGAYAGPLTLNADYHVRVLDPNTTPGSLEGLRVQLFRGAEAVGPVVSFSGVAAGSATGVDLGSVDGVTFRADLAVPGSGTMQRGERSDGLATTGSASLDGGAPVAVDLTRDNNILFTGGSAGGYTPGATATVNFAQGAFSGGTFTLSGAAARLEVDRVVAADTDKVAAATDPAASGDGEMARRIASLASVRIFEDTDDTASGFLGTTVQALGARGREAEVFEQASSSILLQLEAQSESVSGVNVDEEMVLLIQYQRGFEAAARFLTTVDGLLDTLINGLGR